MHLCVLPVAFEVICGSASSTRLMCGVSVCFVGCTDVFWVVRACSGDVQAMIYVFLTVYRNGPSPHVHELRTHPIACACKRPV